MENPIPENTLAQCLNWEFPELQLRCAALGIGEDAQKQLYLDLFRTLSAEKWAEGDRRLRWVRSHLADGSAESVRLALSRNQFNPPPAKSLADLEAEALAWFKAARRAGSAESFARPADFLTTVSDYIADLEPELLRRRALTSALLAIASGRATHLPRPAAPPAAPPAPAEFFASLAENATRHAADREALEKGVRQGRGVGGPRPQPERVG